MKAPLIAKNFAVHRCINYPALDAHNGKLVAKISTIRILITEARLLHAWMDRIKLENYLNLYCTFLWQIQNIRSNEKKSECHSTYKLIEDVSHDEKIEIACLKTMDSCSLEQKLSILCVRNFYTWSNSLQNTKQKWGWSKEWKKKLKQFARLHF